MLLLEARAAGGLFRFESAYFVGLPLLHEVLCGCDCTQNVFIGGFQQPPLP